MKKFCWRAGEPPRPLQTCSLRRLFATFRLVFKTRESGLCAPRTGRGRKWPNHADFLTFGEFGDFCRPTGCQNFENSGRTPFAPRLFPWQSEAETMRLVRFERARSLRSAEDGRVETLPLLFLSLFSKSAKIWQVFGSGSRPTRDIAKIASNSASAARVCPRTRLRAKSCFSRLFDPPVP